MSATLKLRSKVGLLNALINHPRTSDPERDAARRMLRRLIAKARANGIRLTETGLVDRRTYGTKFDSTEGLRTADIAKMVLADIKMARKIGKKAQTGDSVALATTDPIANAPEQIRYSVRTHVYAGGSSITVTMKNIPAEWGWTESVDDRGDVVRKGTPALGALSRELKAILDAYNYDGSDLMSDFSDVRFYGFVHADC